MRRLVQTNKNYNGELNSIGTQSHLERLITVLCLQIFSIIVFDVHWWKIMHFHGVINAERPLPRRPESMRSSRR